MTKEILHVVPSGSDETLCGLDADKLNNDSFSSLGLLCNCKSCLVIAKKLIKTMKDI